MPLSRRHFLLLQQQSSRAAAHFLLLAMLFPSLSSYEWVTRARFKYLLQSSRHSEATDKSASFFPAPVVADSLSIVSSLQPMEHTARGAQTHSLSSNVLPSALVVSTLADYSAVSALHAQQRLRAFLSSSMASAAASTSVFQRQAEQLQPKKEDIDQQFVAGGPAAVIGLLFAAHPEKTSAVEHILKARLARPQQPLPIDNSTFSNNKLFPGGPADDKKSDQIEEGRARTSSGHPEAASIRATLQHLPQHQGALLFHIEFQDSPMTFALAQARPSPKTQAKTPVPMQVVADTSIPADAAKPATMQAAAAATQAPEPALQVAVAAVPAQTGLVVAGQEQPRGLDEAAQFEGSSKVEGHAEEAEAEDGAESGLGKSVGRGQELQESQRESRSSSEKKAASRWFSSSSRDDAAAAAAEWGQTVGRAAHVLLVPLLPQQLLLTPIRLTQSVQPEEVRLSQLSFSALDKTVGESVGVQRTDQNNHQGKQMEEEEQSGGLSGVARSLLGDGPALATATPLLEADYHTQEKVTVHLPEEIRVTLQAIGRLLLHEKQPKQAASSSAPPQDKTPQQARQLPQLVLVLMLNSSGFRWKEELAQSVRAALSHSANSNREKGLKDDQNEQTAREVVVALLDSAADVAAVQELLERRLKLIAKTFELQPQRKLDQEKANNAAVAPTKTENGDFGALESGLEKAAAVAFRTESLVKERERLISILMHQLFPFESHKKDAETPSSSTDTSAQTPPGTTPTKAAVEGEASSAIEAASSKASAGVTPSPSSSVAAGTGFDTASGDSASLSVCAAVPAEAHALQFASLWLPHTLCWKVKNALLQTVYPLLHAWRLQVEEGKKVSSFGLQALQLHRSFLPAYDIATISAAGCSERLEARAELQAFLEEHLRDLYFHQLMLVEREARLQLRAALMHALKETQNFKQIFHIFKKQRISLDEHLRQIVEEAVDSLKHEMAVLAPPKSIRVAFQQPNELQTQQASTSRLFAPQKFSSRPKYSHNNNANISTTSGMSNSRNRAEKPTDSGAVFSFFSVAAADQAPATKKKRQLQHTAVEVAEAVSAASSAGFEQKLAEIHRVLEHALLSALRESAQSFLQTPFAQTLLRSAHNKAIRRFSWKKFLNFSVRPSLSFTFLLRAPGEGNLQGFAAFNGGLLNAIVGFANDAPCIQADGRPAPRFRMQPKLHLDIVRNVDDKSSEPQAF